MMDDFTPRKPVRTARVGRTSGSNLDDEIGDAFVSPEEMASRDAKRLSQTAPKDESPLNTLDESNTQPLSAKKNNPQVVEKPKLKWWPPKGWTKKQWGLVIGSTLLLCILIGGLALALSHQKPIAHQTTPPKIAITPPPKPTTVASRLTGLQVTPEQSKLPVTGVMIENSMDARPQSGLDQAGVVYEAVAEGGITRFLALFEDNRTSYIGPVRSSRPYYLRWLLPFDASYAHVGGSPDALANIKTLGVKDLDQFYNSGAYERIPSRNAPHNVYTSIDNLLKAEKDKGFDNSTFTGFTRKADAPSKTPNPTNIDFTISGPAYSVHYEYDATTNSYKRNEGGAPHLVIDKNGTSTQLAPKVVIALVMPQSSGALDASGAYYTQYDTSGSGQMYVFQDGLVTTGTWSKATDKSQFSFSDSTGKPIALNAGQTWISVVGLAGDVAYK